MSKNSVEMEELQRGDGWEFYAKSSPRVNFGRACKRERDTFHKKSNGKKEERNADKKCK